MGTLDYRGPAVEMWRSTQCPECGYCLTGLPEAGRCPECGYEYSPRQVILWGWAGRSKGNLSNIEASGLGRVFLSLPMPLGVVLYQFCTGHFDRFAIAIVLTVTGVVNGYLLYRYRRNTTYTPRPTQVRLSPEGFGQRDGVGSLKLTPWNKKYWIWLGASGSCYRLRIYPRWLAFTFVNPVDLEFDCDAETVERIREHLEWCQGSSKR